VRQRWFSRRALQLHLAVVLWVPVCLIAFWWQVHRAFDGNGLSYLYSAEWPIFAVLGVWAWWVLVHTDPERAGARGQRKMAERLGAGGAAATTPPRRGADEDDELAAYNDRLAELARRGPKTWRNS